MAETRRVSFHTLGCKLNFSETSTIARQFEQGGYERTSSASEADVCIINTCSVTEHADKKCRNLIRKLHRDNPSAIIAVTGCYAQLKPHEIVAIEGVDLVLSNRDKGDLYERVAALAGRGRAQVYSCDTQELTNFFAAFSSGDRTRSFLKVQDGCDYKCAYCTIHYARGGSRNIPVADIVAQARRIAAGGCREIVITGVNTGDFGRSTGETFADLLRALEPVEGIERYRISSIEPNLLTDEVLDICAASPKFQPHFHIPLQSGSAAVLKAMGRRYDPETFERRIEAVRRRMPDAFIGIDVIVGLPGEGEKEFSETFDLLSRTAPAYLHVFPFSERPGTPACDMPGKVRDSVKTERAERLGELCRKLHGEFYRSQCGKSADVLFESRTRGGMMFGYTGNYVKCRAACDPGLLGAICRVRLTGIGADGLMEAEVLK